MKSLKGKCKAQKGAWTRGPEQAHSPERFPSLLKAASTREWRGRPRHGTNIKCKYNTFQHRPVTETSPGAKLSLPVGDNAKDFSIMVFTQLNESCNALQPSKQNWSYLSVPFSDLRVYLHVAVDFSRSHHCHQRLCSESSSAAEMGWKMMSFCFSSAEPGQGSTDVV